MADQPSKLRIALFEIGRVEQFPRQGRHAVEGGDFSPLDQVQGLFRVPLVHQYELAFQQYGIEKLDDAVGNVKQRIGEDHARLRRRQIGIGIPGRFPGRRSSP